jgi:hypothetical protein
MFSVRAWNARWTLLCVLGISLTGCGRPENIGQVSGMVTLNGQPLPGALIQFEPLAGGSPSGGYTDESGQYSLTYNREVQGAEIGEHRVLIRTKDLGNPDSDPPRPKKAESVPARYNTKSELTAKVEAGKNQIDFPLEGTVAEKQPKSK